MPDPLGPWKLTLAPILPELFTVVQSLTQEMGCWSLLAFMSRNISMGQIHSLQINCGLVRLIFKDSRSFLVSALCNDTSVRWGNMETYL